MLKIIENHLSTAKTDEEKVHLLREFLQILILKILRDKGAFENIVFLGGTALRIVHKLRRYSEDLDFSLQKSKGYDFINLINKLQNEFKHYGLDLVVKTKIATAKSTKTIKNQDPSTMTINGQDPSNIDSAQIKFPELLYKLGLSPLKDQNISIKIEIDTNPPKGANTKIKILNEHFIFEVVVHDIPSLMAGKLAAIFCREYDKGRDYYDLLWYLTSGFEPNLEFLNNSLEQLKKQKLCVSNWKQLLVKELEQKNYKQIHEDLRRFIMDQSELDLIKFETFAKLLT